MKSIHLTAIIILPDRQRKDFDVDSLSEMATTFQDGGILNPIVLRSDTDCTLVAGERRIRAAKIAYSLGHTIKHDGEVLPVNHIPYTTLGDLTEAQYEEIELIENVQREDLTFQEYAIAVDKLHKLRLSENPNQTASDTANEIRLHEGKAPNPTGVTKLVRDNCIIANNLSDPDVAKAKSKKEALKIIKKKKLTEVFNELAKTPGAQAARDRSTHALEKGDARELLRELPSETFDCIITDPPYGINAQSFGDQADGVHDYVDTPEYFAELMGVFAEESFRVCKPASHMYLFHDLRYFQDLRKQFECEGWLVWKTPIIWYKHGGMLPRPEHGPRRVYEAILFATKGDRKTLCVKNDCIVHISKPAKPRHAAEKPAELYVDLLERTCRPGDRILDPFAGSGPVFPAANHLQLTATGFNLSEDDYALAFSRLSEQL